MSATLTGNQHAVLQCIEYWWAVIIRKASTPGARRCGRIDPQYGAPITRLSAADVRTWLLKKGVDLSLRQIRHALKGLIEKGRVLRLKEWEQCWNHSYSYQPPLDELTRINPKKVGYHPIPNSSEVFHNCRGVQTETSAPTDVEGHSDVTSVSHLSVTSAVPSSVSSTGNAEPARIAALLSEPTEPEQPEVEIGQTPAPVKDEEPIEHHQPTEETEGSEAPLNPLNTRLAPQVLEVLKTISREWSWSFFERTYVHNIVMEHTRSVRQMEAFFSGWKHSDADWTEFYDLGMA